MGEEETKLPGPGVQEVSSPLVPLESEPTETKIARPPITLGLSMIMKNEEANIARTLASVEGIDEIVIVDTGSTDNSIMIAREMGATVIEGVYEWKDDFADARNFAIRQCKSSWLLLMDSDEVLQPGGIEAARRVIEGGLDQFPNLQDVQCFVFHDKDEFYSDRLLINDPDNVFYLYPIHEFCNAQVKIRTDDVKIEFTISS